MRRGTHARGEVWRYSTQPQGIQPEWWYVEVYDQATSMKDVGHSEYECDPQGVEPRCQQQVWACDAGIQLMDNMTSPNQEYREKSETDIVEDTNQPLRCPVASSVRTYTSGVVQVVETEELEMGLEQGLPRVESSLPQHKMWVDEDWTPPWKGEYG